MSAAKMLETLLASEVTGDLLVLFHRNPGLIDTLDSVARRIGRTGSSIEEDVQTLVNVGILKTRKIGRSEVLLLDRAKDQEVLDVIAKHLKNLQGVEKIDHTKY
jgi:predicted transcriptional regulator